MWKGRVLKLGAVIVATALGFSGLAEAGASTVFYNGHVFTAEPAHPYAEAVAIKEGVIVAVGSRETVKAAAGSDATLVDLHGQFLMPGMIDAHAHPVAGGVKLSMASFPTPAGSVAALTQFVEKQIEAKTSRLGDILVVYDIDLGYWLHVDEIDAALSSGAGARTPIVLFGSDGHTAWANKLVRDHAGITAAFLRKLSKDQQAYYGTDKHGNPNGFVVDVGKHKLDTSLPEFSDAAMLAAGEGAVRYMNSMGVTAWLEAAVAGSIGGTAPLKATEPGYLPVYRELGKRGELTAHVTAYAVVRPSAGLGQIAEVEALQAKYSGIPNFALVGLKVFADGVVEFPSQTALLSKPYLNTGRTTSELYTREQMAALVTEADKRGLWVHVHAIGDLAVRNSLDAFAAARKANPHGTRPFVMTHVQFAGPDDAPRFAQLNVIAALQLLWAVADPTTIDPVEPYVDPAIFKTMYPARSILDSGGTIAGASDWPVSSANPFVAMFQAETRSGPKGVLNAAERVPRESMLYAYTRNAAIALGQLESIGTIAPGKRADLALIDRDVLTVPADELKDAQVVWTLFGGQTVYRHGH
jgi:predicted amidohydrolase YtcJ